MHIFSYRQASLMMIDDLRSVIDDLRKRFALHIYIIEEFHISKISNHQSQIINNCPVSRLRQRILL